jgi:hypothetical protein
VSPEASSGNGNHPGFPSDCSTELSSDDRFVLPIVSQTGSKIIRRQSGRAFDSIASASLSNSVIRDSGSFQVFALVYVFLLGFSLLPLQHEAALGVSDGSPSAVFHKMRASTSHNVICFRSFRASSPPRLRIAWRKCKYQVADERNVSKKLFRGFY